jgi:hypothetical protein
MLKKNFRKKKKVCLLTTGSADPTQGGSGIFNYYILKELIRKKYIIDVYILKDPIFFKTKINKKYLNKLRGKINQIFYIKENIFNKFYYLFLFGLPLLKYLHNYTICKSVIKKLKVDYDAFVSLSLGWAMALSIKKKLNVLSILGDPKHLLLFERHRNFKSIFSFIHLIKAKSLGSKSVISKVGNMFITTKNIIASFSIHHAKEYSDKGLKCITLDWFSLYVKKYDLKLNKNFDFKKNIKFLHVGDLTSTASVNDSCYKIDKISKILIKKKIDNVEFRFVGYPGEKIKSNYDNIDFIYKGRKDNLYSDFAQSDIYLYLRKYSIGTRTRVITAMSYGMPVIADISVLAGLYRLKNRHDIILVKDLDEFSKVINDIVDNPHFLTKISINARRTWEKYYNPKINTPLLLKKINL